MADRLPAVICDLDGTLALLNGRSPYDASGCLDDILNEPIAHIVRTYADIGMKILLCSGRDAKYRKLTEMFLSQHGIPYDALFMRRSRDFRKDAVMKAEVYNAEIREKYAVTVRARRPRPGGGDVARARPHLPAGRPGRFLEECGDWFGLRRSALRTRTLHV